MDFSALICFSTYQHNLENSIRFNLSGWLCPSVERSIPNHAQLGPFWARSPSVFFRGKSPLLWLLLPPRRDNGTVTASQAPMQGLSQKVSCAALLWPKTRLAPLCSRGEAHVLAFKKGRGSRAVSAWPFRDASTDMAGSSAREVPHRKQARARDSLSKSELSSLLTLSLPTSWNCVPHICFPWRGDWTLGPAFAAAADAEGGGGTSLIQEWGDAITVCIEKKPVLI